MESYWFIITVSLCLIAIIKSTITALSTSKPLPPGPLRVPIIGNLIWLRNSLSDLESILRRLKARYGPLITLRIGPRPFIFVSSHSLAHFALVQNGALFSDRPAPALTSKLLNPSQKGISSAPYGATWRLFRRNLTHEILNPARVRSYSGSRHWVLTLLVNRILEREDDFVRLIDHFQYAMFSLLALMCFGDRLGEEQIKEIERVQRRLLLSFRRLNALNIWGKLGKVLFRSRWKELVDLREDQKSVLLPLIRARIVAKQLREVEEEHLRDGDGNGLVVAYVDTLMDLQLPEEDNRKLEDWEMVNLCSEFLTAGTDTTSTALQWIMANLVKCPELQSKLYDEIVGVKGRPPVVSAGGSLPEVVEEEDLQKMPYLKAVVLEGLRRHPPGHFVLPHRVSRDVDVDGYVIPKNAIVNFMVADMGWDSKVWEQPMEFKPERFLDEGAGVFDVTGSKEIKMMPFGAGRRICPASGLAMLHLEYFVANLIWYFEWTPRQGEEIDLTEKQEFTIVMKNPLCARISPRNCS